MKFKAFALIIAILCLAMVFAGCKDTETTCTSHVDKNKDGKCDVCGAAVEIICTEHVDADTDGKCDVCGAEVEITCTEHKDADNNGKCDICDADMPQQKPACETHVDADADGYCDGCNGAIVVIYEKIEPTTEERVPMIVSRISEDASMTDYIVTTVEELTSVKTAELSGKEFSLLNKSINANLARYDIVKEDGETGEVLYHTYGIYDVMTGKDLYKANNEYKGAVDGAWKTVSINTDNDYYFEVTTTVVEPRGEDDPIVERSYECYTYDGIKRYSVNWKSNNDDNTSWDDVKVDPNWNEKNGIGYITFGDKVYAFDCDTKEYTGFSFDKDKLVYRPSFDNVVGDYGYVEYDDKLFVYDLTKWRECIYSHELENGMFSAYDDWFVLSNGNVLIQRITPVPSDSVSYDVLAGSSKYNLEYTLVDIAEKKATNVEFGYYIEDAWGVSDSSFFENADNLFVVHEIENSNIKSATLYLLVSNTVSADGQLQITCDVTEVENWSLVDDGLFVVRESYDSYTSTRKIVDKSGNLITYIPEGAIIGDNCIWYDGDYYNFKMELIIDCDKYTVEEMEDTYAILSETIEIDGSSITNYYYYNFKTSKNPEALDSSCVSVKTYEWGYIMRSERLTDSGDTKETYTLYNADGDKLCDVCGDDASCNEIDGGYVVNVYKWVSDTWSYENEYYILK